MLTQSHAPSLPPPQSTSKFGVGIVSHPVFPSPCLPRVRSVLTLSVVSQMVESASEEAMAAAAEAQGAALAPPPGF